VCLDFCHFFEFVTEELDGCRLIVLSHCTDQEPPLERSEDLAVVRTFIVAVADPRLNNSLFTGLGEVGLDLAD